MSNRMSAKDYREQVVQPALDDEKSDEEFLNKVLGPKNKKKKINKKIVLGEAERDIQKRILERLGMVRGGFFWRENSGMVKQTDAHGKIRMWRAGIKGIADIVGVYKGKFIGIEVKAPGKKPSGVQKAFLARVRECGGVAFVCDNDKEVVRELKIAVGEIDPNDEIML